MPRDRKPGFGGGRDILVLGMEEAGVRMAVFKDIAVVGAALFALLFVSDALFGDEGGEGRFDSALYDSATYAPRPEHVAAMEELRVMRDATPAVRVREVFAQFAPGESRRGKRYASLMTLIR